MEENQEVMYKLGGIESTIKSIDFKLDTFIKDTKEQHNNHEGRISTLEKQTVQIWTVGGILGSISGLFVSLAAKWLNLS